jgi:hypothetical protein
MRRVMRYALSGVPSEGLAGRCQYLFPSPDLFDDCIWISGPDEGFWVVVGFDEVSVDGRLEINDALEHASLEPLSSQVAKKPSTALSQDADVGVKWKWNLGCRSSQARTFGCLCVA